MRTGLGKPSGEYVSTKKEGFKMIQLMDLAKRLPEKWIQEKGTGFSGA